MNKNILQSTNTWTKVWKSLATQKAAQMAKALNSTNRSPEQNPGAVYANSL